MLMKSIKLINNDYYRKRLSKNRISEYGIQILFPFRNPRELKEMAKQLKVDKNLHKNILTNFNLFCTYLGYDNRLKRFNKKKYTLLESEDNLIYIFLVLGFMYHVGLKTHAYQLLMAVCNDMNVHTSVHEKLLESYLLKYIQILELEDEIFNPIKYKIGNVLLQDLDEDTLRTIAVNLPINDIVNLCKTNKWFNEKLCDCKNEKCWAIWKIILSRMSINERWNVQRDFPKPLRVLLSDYDFNLLDVKMLTSSSSGFSYKNKYLGVQHAKILGSCRKCKFDHIDLENREGLKLLAYDPKKKLILLYDYDNGYVVIPITDNKINQDIQKSFDKIAFIGQFVNYEEK